MSAFGASGQQPRTSLFGQTPSSFGMPQQTPGFGQTQPSFGQSPQPSLFGQTGQSPFFGGQQQEQMSASGGFFGQQQQASPFQSQPAQQMNMLSGSLTTQMAPVAPMVVPLPDREIQAIVDAYRDDVGKAQDGFKYLVLSVTDPAARFKPAGVSDILWAEAMNKLECMDSLDRERLWPELLHSFKDLSRRMQTFLLDSNAIRVLWHGFVVEYLTHNDSHYLLNGLDSEISWWSGPDMNSLEDEATTADVQRLQATESNVKLLRRHFETDTMPWIHRLRQKELELQRRLLKIMKMVEGLEGKGMHMALSRGEADLGEHLLCLMRQLQGASAELPRRVEALMSASRVQVGLGSASQSLLLGLGKIDNQSLTGMQEVLRQQTMAISRLATFLKRDKRDIDIILTKNTEIVDGYVDSDGGKYRESRPVVGFTKLFHAGH